MRRASRLTRHPQLAISGLLAGLLLASPGSADVIGSDDRRPPDAGAAQLSSAIGVISCTGEAGSRQRPGRATASVVGNRRTVLTAAHVFTNDTGTGLAYRAETDCRFRQYDADGELIADVGFARAAYGGFVDNTGLPNQDWAVLRTDQALPATTHPLAFTALDFDDLGAGSRLPIATVAFHADRRDDRDWRDRRRTALLSEGALFTVSYAGFRRLAHTADMSRMASGAPLVHRTPDGVERVVGVHRSSAQFGDYNLAVPLTPELEAVLRSFAWGEAPAGGLRLARATPRVMVSCCSMVDAAGPAE